MRRLLILISLILVVFSFNGCGNKVNSNENVSEKEFMPYEKLTLINKVGDMENGEWTDTLRGQLIEKQEVCEMTTDRLLKNGIFKEYQLELAGIQEYDSKTYPYKISADLVIWQCDGYYTICEIKNKKLESCDKNIKLIMEDSLEVWTDGLDVLKVVPTNDVIKFDIGGSASFKEKENEKIGPFTIVYKVNFSCPSAQVY
ncbi:MAG: hypothetical protein AB9836_09310 [Aminipila sp.]